MGLTAAVSSSASTASSSAAGVSETVTSLLSPVGMGVGGIVVAIALVGVLAYLDIISATPDRTDRIEQTLVAAAIPLGFTFAGIVAFQTMTVL
jgi:hypothetical protein